MMGSSKNCMGNFKRGNPPPTKPQKSHYQMRRLGISPISSPNFHFGKLKKRAVGNQRTSRPTSPSIEFENRAPISTTISLRTSEVLTKFQTLFPSVIFIGNSNLY